MPKLNVHLSSGILIGMGIILIALGSLGWDSVNYMYGTFSRALEDAGLDPSRHYIFRELNQLISTYMMFAVVGCVSLILGVLIEKKRILNIDRWEEIPHGSLINGLWGAGGALALLSLQDLFYYMLTSSYINLELFIAFGTIGIFLIILGTVIYTRRKTNSSKPQK